MRKQLVREVKLENEERVSYSAQVNKEIEVLYRKMYTAKMKGNMDNHVSEQKFDEFIEDLNILQLNDNEESLLEEDFTINELKEALTSLADNKSPNLF